MEPGDVVLIRASDDVAEHLFRVAEVYEDCICGVALTRPFQGEYGEPELSMVIRVLDPAEVPLELKNPSRPQKLNEKIESNQEVGRRPQMEDACLYVSSMPISGSRRGSIGGTTRRNCSRCWGRPKSSHSRPATLG
jgi:hypothetical protein